MFEQFGLLGYNSYLDNLYYCYLSQNIYGSFQLNPSDPNIKIFPFMLSTGKQNCTGHQKKLTLHIYQLWFWLSTQTQNYEPFWSSSQKIVGKLDHWHGCWCPGSQHHQDISHHVIGIVRYMGFCLPSRRISINCAISTLRNDGWCNCMYYFPEKYQAWQGLSVS